MHISWSVWLTSLPWLAALAVIAFFSWRYQVRFWRRTKRNRAAGMYDDPEFKKRIKPLNIWRLGMVSAMLLAGVAAIWASAMGIAPWIYWTFFLVFTVPTTIWSGVIERRWRKLMTEGLE